MADDDGKPAKASKFLKKSKWGKIFKEDDSGHAGRQGTFILNEDVVDFLKPSTDKHVPKIDIAIAQRWPDAHDVRSAGGASPVPPQQVQQQEQQWMGYTKPKGKKGLTVAFAKTVPEVIGEGGDDAQDPPREIGRLKAMVSRSVSDRRPGSLDQGQSQQQQQQQQSQRMPPLPQAKFPSPPQINEEDDFVPQPMRRVQTSHNEFSPAMQRKIASPPSAEAEPHRPSLGRVPTGFKNYDMQQHTTPVDTPIDKLGAVMGSEQPGNDRPRSRDRPPAIDTQFDQSRPEPDSAYSYSNSEYSNTPSSGLAVNNYHGLSLAPRDTASPVMQKRKEMSANEGMAFKRASMLVQQDQSDEDDSPPQSRHPQQAGLTPQASNFAAPQKPAFKSRSPIQAHESAVRPDGLNPFADPKYIKRHSRDVTPEKVSPIQPQSLRQNTREQAYTHTQSSNPYQYRDNSAPYLQQRPNSREHYLPQIAPPQSYGHQRVSSRERNYLRTTEPPEDMVHSRQAQQPTRSQNIIVPQASTQDRFRPGLRDRPVDSSNGSGPETMSAFSTRPNGSSISLNHSLPGASHSRTSSRDGTSPSMLHPTGSGPPQSLSPQSPRFQDQMYSQSAQEQDSKSSLLGPGRGPTPSVPSPKPRASPEDYFVTSRSPQPQPPKSAAANLRQEDAGRPTSSDSIQNQRPTISPQPPEQGNPAADAAFADFAGRVAHMQGVFRLTAEKEVPAERCTPSMWVRSALWWYLKSKAGLEILLQQCNTNEPRREFLTQAHVDLAKAWWILSDSLDAYDTLGERDSGSARTEGPDSSLTQGVFALKTNLKSLSLSMRKNQLLPPTQSLIQGQDTRIWLEYPRFTSDAAAVLGGNTSTSRIVDDSRHMVGPYEVLPLSDTRTTFCYGRFPVEVFLNTEDAETDRVVMPCMLTVLRGRRDYQTSIAIASQNELVSIKISPAHGENKSLTWSDVSWKASSYGMVIRLPRSFDLSVRMHERDFRAVWNLSEYARKVEKSLRAEPDEKLVHEARLTELQYADSSNSNAFPPDKIRGCMALIYERTVDYTDGNGMRKLHRGYRVLLITDPGHKMLSSVSHDLCRRTPLYFEFMTDSAANGTTAMVIRIRAENRQCRILLVFPDMQRRQALYDIINGLAIGPDETIVGRMSFTSLNIEAAPQTEGFSQSAHPVLQALQWQKLGVTNGLPDDPNSRIPPTVQSDHLRIVARHASGCITDRMNLAKGELLLRLPAAEAPAVQILRQPQEDMIMSIDTRHSPQRVSDGIGQLLNCVLQQPTIRTFTFASQPDLHSFQTAITGFTVRYDGLASTLSISRRRMVVPIYKKWEASNVRLQILSKDSVVQLIAFMEDFSHADALCFQVKSTDVFETIKGDNKHKKWGVKLVDAKFSLPPSREKGEVNEEEAVRKRFINLEGLDYAEEHDDITIGFESEQERDRFAQALPAATSVSRGITLKRRI